MASATQDRQQALSDLPVELWLQIANHLPPRDAVVLATANRRLYHTLIDQAYYRSVNCDKISMAALMWAIQHNSLATAERALAQGQDPNQLIDHRYFRIGEDGLPLTVALNYPSTGEPNLEIIKLLLRYGADPYATCTRGNPITISAKRGNRACLEVLLSDERDFRRLATFRDQNGLTGLHSAAIRDHPDILEYLVERGVKINARDTHGRTALVHAVYAGCHGNVAWLLRAGADPFVAGHDAWNLAEVAVTNLSPADLDGPRHDIFGLVTEAVYSDKSSKAWYHMTESQLHDVLLRTYSNRALEALCAFGANFDAKSQKGVTVFWITCGYTYGAEEGARDLAQTLIDGGADINFKSPGDGSTPMMQAIKAHASEIVPVLLRRRNDLDLTIADHEGKTALDWAVELNRDLYADELRATLGLM